MTSIILDQESTMTQMQQQHPYDIYVDNLGTVVFIQFFDKYDPRKYSTIELLTSEDWDLENEQDYEELVECIEDFFDMLSDVLSFNAFFQKKTKNNNNFFPIDNHYLSPEELDNICSFVDRHNFLKSNSHIDENIRIVYDKFVNRGSMFSNYSSVLAKYMECIEM
jgi:hypothetical protein